MALEEARAAGFRFLGMKFDLQRRVLLAYYDLALVEEQIRIQKQNVDLLAGIAESASARVQAGAPQQDLLKAQIEHRLAENELQNMEAQRRSAQAMLNGLLSRPPEAALTLPAALPVARPVPANDEKLLTMGVGQNPELAALAAQVAGREDALELARLRYIPDINPMFSFTGSVSQALGAMVMLPTTLPAIKGAIAESQAMLRWSQATSRQTARDRAASFVTALFFLRNAERQTELFQTTILSLAEQAMNSSRVSYMAGTVSYSDLIDSQRTLLNVRLMTAQVRIEREKRLAELEALAGTDIETLTPSSRAAAVAPTVNPR
jgi:outer membrane protein TolC